ncbi:MAG: SDR family NAD(P)-dependent oxidoreductase [Defluviitaleaceae bacterium]|nr:SDR family NAD(P)-dependent oxidoreductase [Defluviitaleaceae bacterium]
MDWQLEQDAINTAINYFIGKKSGHLVFMSSVAASRGSAKGPAYNASKAYASNYLEGIRCKVEKLNLKITVTDIKDGLVDTAMAKGEGLFWAMPLGKAAKQIYNALLKRKKM